jgi:hypothetical protein
MVEVRQILIRFEVSRLMNFEITSKASGIGILVYKDTTSKLTRRSCSSRWKSLILLMKSIVFYEIGGLAYKGLKFVN